METTAQISCFLCYTAVYCLLLDGLHSANIAVGLAANVKEVISESLRASGALEATGVEGLVHRLLSCKHNKLMIIMISNKRGREI